MTELMNPGAVQRFPEFPLAPSDWSPDQAREAAARDGIDLTEDHWATVRALHGLFANDPPPNVRTLHDALGEAFHPKGGLKYLFGLFPGGPVAQGCRFAGLVAPSGAVDKSFGSVQ